MSKPKGRTPDFVVKALHKELDKSQRVGAAWRNPDGSISIDLDVFTVLDGKDRPVINLFPWENKE